uniref:Defensin n=1 Tax=Panagrolaimus sp. ES5 TaxID=591445 RepID=A0AC34GCI1_9BILA
MQLTRFKKVLFIAFFAAIALAVMSNATETSSSSTTTSTTTASSPKTEVKKATEKNIEASTGGASTTPESIITPEDTETPDEEAQHDGTISRVKRQWGCPSNCYGSCSSNVQCRRYNVRSVCVQGCCCGSSTNISTVD